MQLHYVEKSHRRAHRPAAIKDPLPDSVPTAVPAFVRCPVSGEPLSPSRFIHAVTVKSDRQVKRRASGLARSESYWQMSMPGIQEE